MSISVYTKSACPQCKATRRYLDKADLKYEVIDLSEDPEAAQYVASLGYHSVPVVVVGEDHWSGFRIEKIAELSKS